MSDWEKQVVSFYLSIKDDSAEKRTMKKYDISSYDLDYILMSDFVEEHTNE